MNSCASESLDASVVVCTYNRCESLADTLNALGELQIPANFRWELLIVDNNSRDKTRETVSAFASRQPDISVRYLFQPRQGLSNARNMGIEAARGEYVVFTDDDVLPESNWLTILVQSMREYECTAAGGYIEPLWLAPPPSWLTERFYGFLALRTQQGRACQVKDQDEMPFGASLAFRRDTFDRLGNFDPKLGRNGKTLAGGEEIDILMRIVENGERVMYFPQARVRHKVESFRLRKQYFRRWRYQCSLNEAQAWPPNRGRAIAGVPLYIFAQLLASVWRSAVMGLTRPPDEAFRQEMIIWHFLGTIRGLVRRNQSGESQ